MYQGYLIKLGGDKFPMKYIVSESYKINPNQRQDLNSTRNANGRLLRHVVDNEPSKIEFQVHGANGRYLDGDTLEEIQSFIRKHFSVEKERKVVATFYCPDTNDYKQEEMYMPDPQYTIRYADENRIEYADYTLKFIGY